MTPFLRNGYESEAGTAMLATECLLCGRPLRDPESLERGVGPYCAERQGMFVAAGSPDLAAFAEALQTAPRPMAEAVDSKMPDPRAAVSAAIHAAGRAWESRASDSGHYIGSAIELATALGYAGTARALTNVFIEGVEYKDDGTIARRGKQRGIVIQESEPSSRGEPGWEIRLPYLEGPTWKATKAAMKAAGVRTYKDRDGKWHDVFPQGERQWLLVLNSLVDTLGGMLGILPNGDTFLVPETPVPVPAPEGRAAGAPTAEAAPPPPPPIEVKEGDRVELKDGRVMIVARTGVNSKGPWVGLMSLADADESMERYGYLFFKRYMGGFCGLGDVKQRLPTQADVADVAEETGAGVAASAAARELPADLQPWQREGVVWLADKRSGILAFEQGVGKTPTALAALDAPVLIVVPASLRENWKREANRWRPDLVVMKIEKAAEVTPEALAAATCVIVGYEAVSQKAVLAALQKKRFQTLIVDEAQALKELRVFRNRQGALWPADDAPARAKAIWRLSQRIPRRFMLTGTPMVNGRPYELWPLLHLVDPAAWGDQKEYWERYCDPQVIHLPARTNEHGELVHGGTALNVMGHANLPELRERIHGQFLLRRTKAVLNLPEKQRIYQSVGLSEDMAAEYRAAAQDFLLWVRRNGGPKAALRAARAEVIARLTALRRIAAIGKVPVVIERAKQFLEDTGRPLILMGHHSEALTAIDAALSELGYRTGMITGDLTGAKRQKAIDAFQTGVPADKPIEKRKFLDVLVCSITAAGVGLTLTRAQDMMMIERVWRPFDLVQAEDRIHRYGQTNQCVITYLDAAGTIDDKIAALLAEKMATAAEVIDGVDLDEDDAQDRVVAEMFGDVMEHLVANSSIEPDFDWASPEVA